MAGHGGEDRIRHLESEGRLLEAAAAAASAGLAMRASTLYEQACEFEQAAEWAHAAGDAQRAVLLGVLAGSDELVARAIDAVMAGDPGRARAASAALRARGYGRVAGTILQRLGDDRDAADAFAEAGAPVDAAASYVRAGDPRAAARVLEAALRSNPGDELAALRLGELLISHAKHDAAMRVLQRIDATSCHRAAAVPMLIACSKALGLTAPLQALCEEAAQLGVADSPSTKEQIVEGASVVYGRYEVVRSVASTHAARVFEAIDRLTGQRVAVKQLVTSNLAGAGRDAFDRLVREARVLERLRHPNVVPLVELLAEAGAIVTPWMPGGSLADLIAAGPIVPARAVEITAAVLAALGEAHGLGILHRDVKPSNVLFDDAGVPRLADFGAAHISDTSATATAGVIGTLAYMSPEQRLGRPATAASDIFSAGATLYEMLVGSPPVTPGEQLVAPSAANAELDSHHDAIVMAMIAEDPAQRPSDVWSVRSALGSIRWPTTPRRQGASLRVDQSAAQQQPGDRLLARGSSVFEDRWLGRFVRVTAATPPLLAIAKVAASLACDGLPSVLRVDGERSTLWWEVPSGETLREARRALVASEREMIEQALAALHGVGLAHGAVDADHVVLRRGAAQLVWEPELINGAQPSEDLAGLKALA